MTWTLVGKIAFWWFVADAVFVWGWCRFHRRTLRDREGPDDD
jgi:hypothetical protein